MTLDSAFPIRSTSQGTIRQVTQIVQTPYTVPQLQNHVVHASSSCTPIDFLAYLFDFSVPASPCALLADRHNFFLHARHSHASTRFLMRNRTLGTSMCGTSTT